ncbi:hypothetical protein [Chroococcidiopsis sp.]|uniref:hypothetical protein n=1 Tax=Chroococcidiopsis sp. TaxID=3088168 RepID=UPI003F384845
MTLDEMNEPKYQIGDRIANKFTVHGLLTLSDGSTRYFIRLGDSDNTFVASEDDLDEYLNFLQCEIDCRHLP